MLDNENVIAAGNFSLVNLNTRITQEANVMVNEIQGWLQTERPLSKVSKQEAIEWMIRYSHAHILEALNLIEKEESQPIQQEPLQFESRESRLAHRRSNLVDQVVKGEFRGNTHLGWSKW